MRKLNAMVWLGAILFGSLGMQGAPLHRVKNREELVSLLSADIPEILARVEQAIEEMRALREVIISIPSEKRTFANTVQAFDYLIEQSDIAIMQNILSALEKVHPDVEVRATAYAAVLRLGMVMIDMISADTALYRALADYAQRGAMVEELTEVQSYVLTGLLEGYEQSGACLPPDQQHYVSDLNKRLQELCSTFMYNIAHDQHHIMATREELAGVHDSVIQALPATQEGVYRVGVDYPTYVAVMTTCKIEETRKRLSLAYNNRAYPENEQVLQEIIARRDELAKILGFASYAHLNLADSMVGSPEQAERFLQALLDKVLLKEEQDIKILLQATSKDSQTRALWNDTQMVASWNMPFLYAEYAREQLQINEQNIAEYFSMNTTITRLLELYRGFFGLEFVEVPLGTTLCPQIWHAEMRLIEVYGATADAQKRLLGYLLLDLHPRPDKFTHACHRNIIPACGEGPAVSMVIANFPRPTADRPALWNRTHDVTTFFHEFGHAVHALLGRSELACVAGTNVKRDFVEMPSQMLEEWLYDTQVLKKISAHYLTGAPLPDDTIERIQRARVLHSGGWARGQIAYALLALAYFGPGPDKNMHKIMCDIQATTSRHVRYDPAYHAYTAFLHLTGYGAQYYGYLWSKVYAVDLFSEIEKAGLHDPAIGARYVREVIGAGGTKDPNELIKTFLGREPQQQAFLQRYGF